MQHFVSIIIPCRNEEGFISSCLDSIFAQDFSKESLEVLAVDGMSQDGTRNIIKKYAEKYLSIRIIENSNKTVPFALNLGIKAAKGDIVIRMDAHAVYARDYISKCVYYMKRYGADNVGGVVKAVAKNQGLIPKAITISLGHPFGAGNSLFRVGVDRPTFVDTVFGGCYKKSIFDKVGFFNEKLERSQDMEFNIRLKKAGGKILLAPDVISYYYPKSNLRDFFLHNVQDGIWAILPLKFAKTSFNLRHYIPLIFLLTFPLSIWPYILASLYFSFRIAVKEKSSRLFFVMPLVFGARHVGYGLGSFFGIVKLVI